jgi:hypothetical protein
MQKKEILLAFLSGVLLTFIYLEKSSILSSIKRYPFIFKSSLINQSISVRSSAFDGCGTWQEAYIERHRAILNGNLPPRYLVSVSVEAGLADRLTGTLTEFFFALFTNRAFQIITYGTLPRFEAAFLSPHINWSRSVDNDTLISNLKYTYRGQRGYVGDRSYGSDVDTRLYWPVYLINDEAANAFFLSSNISKYPIDHDNVSTLFVASNRGRIVRLFDNPYHRSQLFRMGLRPETATKCAFNFLFSPTDSVRTAMSREISILQSIDVLKISVNIRVGDSVFDPNNDASTTLSPFEHYFNCASTIESFARLPNQRVIWYFTSDSLRLRQLVKQRYGEKILTEEKLRYVHGDCGDSNVKRHGNCTKSSHDFSIQMSVGQIYAMSMCDYHVVSRGSGFGRFATFLSHFWHNVYQVSEKNRPCTQTDYDPIEQVSTDGAGI